MKRVWLVVACAAASAFMGGAVLFSGVVQGWWLNSGPSVKADDPAVVARPLSVSPRSPEYGERVTATLTLVVRKDLVDVRTTVLEEHFAPFQAVSQRTERTTDGDLTTLRYTFVLECLQKPCLPLGSTKSMTLRPIRVYYRLRKGSRPQRIFVPWPSVNITTNISVHDVKEVFRYIVNPSPEHSPFRAELAAMPKASSPFGFTPNAVLGVAFGLSALLLLCAAFCVVIGVKRWVVKPMTSAGADKDGLTTVDHAFTLAEKLTSENPEHRAQVSRNLRSLAFATLAQECARLRLDESAEKLEACAWRLEELTPQERREMREMLAKLRVAHDRGANEVSP